MTDENEGCEPLDPQLISNEDLAIGRALGDLQRKNGGRLEPEIFKTVAARFGVQESTVRAIFRRLQGESSRPPEL